MCMIDGAERIDPCIERHPVARKEHRCGECGRTIQPGEQYELVNGVYDGSWVTYKTCSHCEAVRRWLNEVCGGWCYSQVYEDLAEHRNEGYNPRWISIALAGIGRKWRKADGTYWKPLTLPKNLPIGTNT